ncbi:ester cyclase [Acidobacteriota bacterium]
MKKTLFIIFMIISLAAALCITVGCTQQAINSELEELKAQAEIEAQNIEAVYRWLKARNEGKIEKIINEGMFDPNAVYHGTSQLDIPLIENYISQNDIPHSEAVRSIEPILAKGDKVAFRYLVNVNSRGREIKVEAIHILRFVDGKIVETWSVEDSFGFAKQLGWDIDYKQEK